VRWHAVAAVSADDNQQRFAVAQQNWRVLILLD
jgi:hypothetical protein